MHHLPQKIHEVLSFFRTQFSAQKIHGRDSACTFVDTCDLAVPKVLFHGVLGGKSVAAEYLEGLGTDVKAFFGTIAFQNGGEDFIHRSIRLTSGG